MKKSILCFVFILAAACVFSQTKSGIKVYIDDQKSVTEKVDNLVVTSLKISATEDQMKEIKKTSNGFSQFSTFTFSDTKDAQGLYSATIKSKPHKDSETDKQFLLKILYSFKAEEFAYKGQTQPIAKFASVVK